MIGHPLATTFTKVLCYMKRVLRFPAIYKGSVQVSCSMQRGCSGLSVYAKEMLRFPVIYKGSVLFYANEMLRFPTMERRYILVPGWHG